MGSTIPLRLHALRGRWLLLARVAWVMVALAVLATFAFSVPARCAQLSHPPVGARAALAETGLSAGGYALYNVTLDAVFVSVFAAVALVIVWRRSYDPVAQLYRYARVSDVTQRQQTKWVVFGVAVAVAGFLATTFTLGAAVDLPPEKVSRRMLLTDALVLAIPVSIGIAVLRSHLFDIDVVINRTMVYGLLTAMLAAVYLGGVTTTQALFRLLTGQERQPQLTIVISTLVIAALFNPFRRRIQAFIDRRFYRRKYDARKTLDVFSSRLRDETDLDELGADLVGMVRETMQPEHVTLWLRPDTGSRSKKGG